MAVTDCLRTGIYESCQTSVTTIPHTCFEHFFLIIVRDHSLLNLFLRLSNEKKAILMLDLIIEKPPLTQVREKHLAQKGGGVHVVINSAFHVRQGH